MQKGTNLSATVILTPVFDAMHIEELKAVCGQCSNSQTTNQPDNTKSTTGTSTLPEKPTSTPTPAPPNKGQQEADHICQLQCRVQYDTWRAAADDLNALTREYAQASFQPGYRMSAADIAKYQQAVAREKTARAAYDECMRHCYSQAVGAGLIPAIPPEFANVTSNPSQTPTSDPGSSSGTMTTPAPPAQTPPSNSAPKTDVPAPPLQSAPSSSTPGNQTTPAPTTQAPTTNAGTSTSTAPAPPAQVPVSGAGALKSTQPTSGNTTGVGQVAFSMPNSAIASAPTSLTTSAPATIASVTNSSLTEQLPSQKPATTSVGSMVITSAPVTPTTIASVANPSLTQPILNQKPATPATSSTVQAAGTSLNTSLTTTVGHTTVAATPNPQSTITSDAKPPATSTSSGVAANHVVQLAPTAPIVMAAPANNVIRVGQNIRPGDYVMMDAIVHEVLGAQWKAVQRLPGGSVLYQSATGQRTASFANGQIVIQ